MGGGGGLGVRARPARNRARAHESETQHSTRLAKQFSSARCRSTDISQKKIRQLNQLVLQNTCGRCRIIPSHRVLSACRHSTMGENQRRVHVRQCCADNGAYLPSWSIRCLIFGRSIEQVTYFDQNGQRTRTHLGCWYFGWFSLRF